VNASPNAVGFYAKVGFAHDGPVLLRNGVRHQPMRLPTRPLLWNSPSSRRD
jgi:predicted GNAT family N-acyltransferase